MEKKIIAYEALAWDVWFNLIMQNKIYRYNLLKHFSQIKMMIQFVDRK